VTIIGKRWMRGAAHIIGAFMAAMAAAPAQAQVIVPDSGDTAWLLCASALVLLMTLPGLALFYGGLVRARNLLSVMMHCFSMAAIASLLWGLAGYSIAFAPGCWLSVVISLRRSKKSSAEASGRVTNE